MLIIDPRVCIRCGNVAPGTEEDRVQVDRDRPSPLLKRDIQRAAEQCLTDVVLDDVDTPEGCEGALDGGVDLVLDEHVCDCREGATAGLPDRVGCPLGCLLNPVHDNDGGAFCRERRRARVPNAMYPVWAISRVPAAEDHRRPTREPVRHCASSRTCRRDAAVLPPTVPTQRPREGTCGTSPRQPKPGRVQVDPHTAHR